LSCTSQLTLTPRIKTTYGKAQYNYVKGSKQRIELHRGCPWGHEYCYEPKIDEDFPIPNLVKNYVEILDMNLLARKHVTGIISQLGEKRVNNKVIHYEAVCGIDIRLLTQDIAYLLKESRFQKPRLAWDGSLFDQYRIKKALAMLLKAGYKPKEISFFMIVNWRIPRVDCERKLDLMKVWNVKVCDCCYDGGYRHATPLLWTKKELVEFRAKCRYHNLIVNFGIDPELKKEGCAF